MVQRSERPGRRESGDRYDQRQRDDVANAASLDRAFASLYMAYQPIVRWGRRELYAYEALVRGIDGSAAQRQIVASTVQLCRALGSEIIAEGVETHAERDALVTIGLDLLQGYLIGRPAAELIAPKL